MQHGSFRRILIPVIMVLIAPALTADPGEVMAQGFFAQSQTLVTADAVTSLSVFHPGSTGYIAFRTEIMDGWHINSDRPLDKFLIPTQLELELPEGIELLQILYPEGEMGKLEFSETSMSLYHGKLNFGAIIRTSREIEPGSYEIKGILNYQGCNNLTCLEPASVAVVAEIRIGTPEETAESTFPEIFTLAPFVDEEGNPVTAGSGGGEQEGSLKDVIEEKGLFLAFILIFLGGLALNLTPCIYPLIPITISYFGGQAGGKTSRTLLLSLFYVLGMSITYSILGIAAAMTGSLFGSALQNPLIIIFISAVLITLSTSMFGLWELRMPTFLMRRTGTAKQGGWGALFMGLTVGIVAAPCIGPFVLGLLTYVGEMGRPVMGFLMFFTLAWGMGSPFIVLAVVSGSITRLPRSGNWMIWVRKIFGFILLIMALYFARFFIGERIAGIGYVILLLAAGVFLGWIDKVPGMGGGFKALRRTVGVVMIAAALLTAFLPGGPVRTVDRPGIDWTPYTAELFESASADGSPVMIDFSADWCIPCHELELLTFSDPAVIAISKNLTTLQADLTRSGETEKKIKEDFGIRGVPTIIFFDRGGKEVEGTRITGFVGPEILLEKMKKVAGE